MVHLAHNPNRHFFCQLNHFAANPPHEEFCHSRETPAAHNNTIIAVVKEGSFSISQKLFGISL